MLNENPVHNPFSNLFNHINEFALISDLNGQITDMNHAFEQFFNITKADFIGKQLIILLKQLNIKIFEENKIDEVLTLLPITDIKSICTINKVEKQIIWSCVPMIINTQNIADGYIVIGKDVTVVQKLNTDVDLLDNIIKYAPDWIYWKDKNSIHLGCNDQFARAAGFSSHQEMIGKSDYDFPWKNRADKYVLDDKEVIELGMPKLNIEDTVVIHNGSEVTVISNKVPLRNAGGIVIGILGIATDITHLKKTEERLKQARLDAEVASLAKTEFIANISHDTRTPLAGVIGLSCALEEKNISDVDRIEYAKLIHEGGEKLLELSESAIEASIANAMTEDTVIYESFDVRRVIHDVMALERPTITLNHISLQMQVDPAIPPILIGDRIKLHRILLNLVGNAIKFTQEGGIELKAQLLAIKNNESTIKFSVKDTGIGIAPENQAKVFDQFFKVSPSYKGLYTGYGLGLHIVHKFLSLMGGQINLESELGVGTTISFELNMKIGDKVANAAAFLDESQFTPLISREVGHKPFSISAKSEEINFNKMQVLLVEDNVAAMTVLKILIKPFAVQVNQALDAETAYDLVKERSFDLIITDVGLPGKQGDELTTMIRLLEKKIGRYPTVIIGCTGHVGHEEHQAYLSAGMNEVYTKPMSTSKLTAIMNLCKKHKANEDAVLLEPNINNTLKASNNNDENSVHNKNHISGACSGLGEDLPGTEAELFEISSHPLIDIQVGIQSLGSEEVMKDIFKDLVEQGISADLEIIKKAHDSADWQTVERYTHKIKGGACYGTVRLFYALLYMERYLKAGHTNCSELLYAQMLAVIDETRAYIEAWLKT